MKSLDAVLDHITLQMTSKLKLREVLEAVSDGLVQQLDAGAVFLWLHREKRLSLAAFGGLASSGLASTPEVPAQLARVAEDGEHLCTNQIPTDGSVGTVDWLLSNGLVALAALPLLYRDQNLGVLAIFVRRRLEKPEFERLFLFARAAAVAIQNARLHAQVAYLNRRLEAQNHFLETEIADDRNCGGIVGKSAAISRVIEQIGQVAATNATVLIEGETGTGKELVARSIHQGSSRRAKPLVRVNCAAISAGLVESELFGHEKGAFTGAVERRLGRFEAADGGTLFLDEVGELPLDVQVKLLRVLQEQEFERVGSSKPLKVDVRVIAAGNRRLADDVAAGRFRADLFYRLNVFPILVPALRDRLEDVPLIATCALPHLARRIGKEISQLAPEARTHLQNYSWPGNVRELLNTLERATILCQGSTVTLEHFSLPKQAPPSTDPVEEVAALETLEEVARRHILRVLDQTRWVIEGNSGAAKILGLHANTLRSRMTRLGIERPAS